MVKLKYDTRYTVRPLLNADFGLKNRGWSTFADNRGADNSGLTQLHIS